MIVNIMEEELDPSGEAKELLYSFVVLEDKAADECCDVGDVESPIVVNGSLDEAEDHANLGLSRFVFGGILDPMIGTEFDFKETHTRNYHNVYAKQTGFSICVGSCYRSNKDNSIISREFCCSKEGFSQEKGAREKRFRQ